MLLLQTDKTDYSWHQEDANQACSLKLLESRSAPVLIGDQCTSSLCNGQQHHNNAAFKHACSSLYAAVQA